MNNYLSKYELISEAMDNYLTKYEIWLANVFGFEKTDCDETEVM